MALETITQVKGRAVQVPGDDIDTDRIIPARFMKCVTFDGLGEYLFYDMRHRDDGSLKEHPLNDAKYDGATILISGANFGCGSSREHAPQAIYRYGFRGIIAESFAEIFFGNCTTLGIPCFVLSRADRKTLGDKVTANPALEVVLDVENQKVRVGDLEFSATVRDTARKALIGGKWDPIAELLEGGPQIGQVASNLPYVRA